MVQKSKNEAITSHSNIVCKDTTGAENKLLALVLKTHSTRRIVRPCWHKNFIYESEMQLQVLSVAVVDLGCGRVVAVVAVVVVVSRRCAVAVTLS